MKEKWQQIFFGWRLQEMWTKLSKFLCERRISNIIIHTIRVTEEFALRKRIGAKIKIKSK